MDAAPDSTAPPAATRRADSGWVGRAARGLTVLLAGAQGALGWWLAFAFQLFGSQPSRGDYLVSAGFAVTSALLLVVGAAALHRLGGRTTAGVALVAGILLLPLAAWSWSTASSASGAGIGNGVLDGVGGALLGPGAWPLEAVVLAALVRQTMLARERRRPARSGS